MNIYNEYDKDDENFSTKFKPEFMDLLKNKS